MAKDYAKRVFTTRPRRKKHWRVELVLLTIVLMGCLSYWVYAHKTAFSTAKHAFLPQMKGFIAAHSETNRTAAVIPKNMPAKAPPVHFDFYTTLPNMQTMTAESEIPSKDTAPSPSVSPSYIVEFGLFNTQSAASQLRLSLLLSGYEADIVKCKRAHTDIYRVQIGPYLAEAEAKKLQRQMQRKGMPGVVKKI